jgi:ring-1,2-phenylacetyl-CoA epoxidase subunit PaaC
MARQFLFDVYHFLMLTELEKSTDLNLSAIAKKSIKEVSYHKRFSSDWIKRLGDGTEESHKRIQTAINDLWTYTHELFYQTEADKAMVAEGAGVDVTKLKGAYYDEVNAVLEEATLSVPESKYFQKGGKQGIHTEHMGYLLANLQYMQRTYPNMEW